MNNLVMLVIVAVMSFEYLAHVGVLPAAAKYVPDVLAVLVLLLVVLHGTRNRFQHLRAAYWFAFGALALTMVSSALANSLQPGPLFVGIRNYLSAVPLFFLPIVYEFSERDVRRQLVLVLALCVPQFPIALGQRMATQAAGGLTGDATVGTLLSSGVLSVFLICVACVLAGAWLRKRMTLTRFLPLFLVVLAPTTINETKATIILLPIGLLVAFITAARRGTRLKNAILAICLVGLFGAIFIPVYDSYGGGRRESTSIINFFTDEKRLTAYVNQNAEVGDTTKAGRVDAILTPLEEMSKDATHLMIGLGIGNVSPSPLGKHFTGMYFRKFEPFLRSSASIFILELGVLGLGLVFTLLYLIFRDARVVAEIDQGLFGAVAAGWAGVTAVMAIAIFYIPFGTSAAISFLFWYFSGQIAARRMRQNSAGALQAAQTSPTTGSKR